MVGQQERNPIEMREESMKAIRSLTRGLAIAGVLILGCQSSDQESAEAVRVQDEAVSVLNDAVAAGRLATAPDRFVVRDLDQASEAAIAYHESTKNLGKAIRTPNVPAYDPESFARHIIEEHQQVPLSEGLRFTISTPKTDYVIGEPVIVRATIENVSDYVKVLPTKLDPQFQYNRFIITGPSGRLMGYSPVTIACTRGNLLDVELAPGESATEDIPIFFDKDGWMFSDVGEYRIQALYRGLTDDAERLDSNVVTIVVNPGTDLDQEAADLLMGGNEQGLFMMWGEGDHLEDGIAALRQIINLYPDTTAAFYARYALGSNMSVEFFDGRYNRHRPPQPLEVKRYMGPVVQAVLDGTAPRLAPSMLEKAFNALADAYESLGDRDQARRIRAALLDVQTDVL